ncbi:MAG: phosphate ABC transporter permease subunit PstC [Defluviitaleaceae bacterium]|nr:phosphate ABC transporter permease subunit PstC [Defluviitaleaceae bacterium]
MHKFREIFFEYVFMFSAGISVLALVMIFVFLFANGMPAIAEIGLMEFIFGREWRPMDASPSFGVLPMIAASIYITLGAMVIGVPVGIFTAVFLAHMCPARLYVVLKPTVNLLAGIPSVVYGFFGIVIIVPFVREISLFFTGGGSGSSMLAAMILLGIMILPTIVNISESAIRAVPRSYYEGSLALGASHTRSVFSVVLPAAKSGVFASVILGVGRAVGETMAVVMVAGNQARMPESIFRGGRALTSNIVIEMGYAEGLHRDSLIATGIVLLVFIFIINIVFTVVTRKSAPSAD